MPTRSATYIWTADLNTQGERTAKLEYFYERDDARAYVAQLAMGYLQRGLPNGDAIIEARRMGPGSWMLRRDGATPVYLRVTKRPDPAGERT